MLYLLKIENINLIELNLGKQGGRKRRKWPTYLIALITLKLTQIELLSIIIARIYYGASKNQ